MTDNAQNNTDNQQNDGQQNDENKNISILTQYLKDISFENPNAPKSLQPSETQPEIKISVDVNAQKLSEQNDFEVVLKITSSAKRTKEENLFLCEVSYAGVFRLNNVPKEELEPILLIFCPSMLFPYMRRIISDTVRDGGYPPLMLDPIDFARLYQQRKSADNNKKA